VAAADGRVLFRRRGRREKLLAFLAAQPARDVVMEACGGAKYWGREIAALGHRVRLVAPAYVKIP
jgi:transposase